MSVRIESQAEPIPGYKLLDRLGSGGFGEVWKAEAPGGIFKAIKVIFGDLRSQDTDLIRYAEQELKALKRVKQVRHPYLLALDRYDIVAGRLLITMELADCNLWDRFRECRNDGLPGIPRGELLTYMAEAAEVLDLMNDRFALQHLDIKPQNLFLLYNHVKVADFGQVKDLQGMMATVTGGITPVYAAPETFDGMITPYCDQYSLACVYQELLTGQRPFDGCSMSQLLMQHIQLPPDLAPSPGCDRPALGRALAKKPNERWPNVSAFVRALKDAGEGRPAGRPAGGSAVQPVSAARPHTGDSTTNLGPAEAAVVHGGVDALSLDTPFPRGLAETDGHQPVVFTPAPPEVTGDGPLRPALVIGIGQAGLRVLQRFRHDLGERYGPRENTPLVRTLFIDTDPDTLDDAARSRPLEHLAGLTPDEVVGAKLNRASHYLKPRLNGRSLVEGWFDQQVLYRIPRTPQTMGVRLLGRLAFCDHYRTLTAKIHAELDAALSPDALHRTEDRTGLRRRTNRPRVYVVAGTAGGTGGGMFLDVAYAVRTQVRRMGYENPDVVGLLIVPPADASLTPPLALGNTYAALTELNHYARPETTFAANYDDRHGMLREKEPPFTRYFLLPGAAGGLNPTRTTPPGSGVTKVSRSPTPAGIAPPGSRVGPGLASGVISRPGSRPLPVASTVRTADAPGLKPYSDAAALLRLDLFTPVGRAADGAREPALADAAGRGGFAAFGLAGFDWPRAEVVARTTATVTAAVLKTWFAPDPKRAREVVPPWAAARWTQLGLDPDAILAHLQAAAEQAAGARIEELITAATEPLVPKGWLGRLPDPDRVSVALDQLVKLFGPPASGAARTPTPIQEAAADAATVAAEGFAHDLRAVGRELVENPQFRLAGAEEVLRQFLATTDRLIDQYGRGAADADGTAQAGYDCLNRYAHHNTGVRKPAGAEIADALRQFPRARYQAVSHRLLSRFYRSVRGTLAGELASAAECRERLRKSAADPGPAPADTIPGPRRLMPPGCLTVADAVERFLGVLNDADLEEIERRVQAALAPEYGGLYEATLHTTAGADGVVGTVRGEARAYLDARLGEVDMGSMFAERFRSRQHAETAVGQAFASAEPEWVGNGPWAAAEVTVFAAPGGIAGQPIRELAARAVPAAGLVTPEARDEVTIYREYPTVPLAAAPHFGPAGLTAYQNLPETNQCTLHSRLDVTRWTDPDKD